MDTDGDGSIDMKEFSAWMKSTDVLATHLRVRMERTSGVPLPARARTRVECPAPLPRKYRSRTVTVVDILHQTPQPG
jgi:hypothetical protein